MSTLEDDGVVSTRIEKFKDNIFLHPKLADMRDAEVFKRNDGRKGTSVIDENGVRVVAGSSHYWRCLVGSCGASDSGTLMKIDSGSTSNATQHLRASHGITSNKTKSAERNLDRLKE